ncbi:type II secretion system protein N [Kineobactrum salinum]|uniref:Type II secretion system protein N n=1 Tax=Kineobactrum salinum TaxID=2708301 RepID=A0A6C0U4S3_9GAMM|nr:type II secretion system protein N [Kineobactrum salinum]QIB66419.1 type II secretion system protein N [Kineobactrum salinum]
MIGRRLAAGVLCLLLLLGCLAVTAPAHLVAWLAPPGQLSAQGFSGSLWQGEASRVVLATEAGPLHLGEVGWRLNPWSLLTLAPRLAIDSRWGEQQLQTGLVLYGADHIGLRDLHLTLDASLLRHLVPVALSGRLTLDATLLQLRRGLPVEAEGRLVWQQAGWESPRGPLALGSYALDARQSASGPLTAELLTLAGPVQAQGQLQLRDSHYSIALQIESETAWDPALQEALALLARPVGATYQLQLEGQLQLPGE